MSSIASVSTTQCVLENFYVKPIWYVQLRYTFRECIWKKVYCKFTQFVYSCNVVLANPFIPFHDFIAHTWSELSQPASNAQYAIFPCQHGSHFKFVSPTCNCWHLCHSIIFTRDLKGPYWSLSLVCHRIILQIIMKHVDVPQWISYISFGHFRVFISCYSSAAK